MHKVSIMILSFGVLVGFVGYSGGQETSETKLSGRIFDSKAEPIVGAEVAAFEIFWDSDSGEKYIKSPSQITKTDAEGDFVFNIAIASQYNVYVVARKDGLALGWDGLNYTSSDKAEGRFNIILEPPCVLGGTVVDEAGTPIAGAKVRAVPKTSYLSRLRQRPIIGPKEWFTTRTDDKGNFSFDNLAADVSSDFWIKANGLASVYEYTTSFLSGCGFEVGRPDICLILPREVAIRGQVIDKKNSQPVAGVNLLMKPDNIREHANPYCTNQVVSDSNGRFCFKGVPAGKHYLKVASSKKGPDEWVGEAVKIDTQTGQDIDDIVVPVGKGGLIEIIVREGTTKQPLSDIMVSASTSGITRRGWSGINGKVQIRMPTGECNVRARADGFGRMGADGTVTAVESEASRLEILLDRTPSISGIVLDESGQPVSGALVKVHPSGGEVLTDDNGKFVSGFEAEDRDRCLIARDIQRNLAAVVAIKDESKPINITVKPALSISGQVTDTDGVGIPVARVSLRALISHSISEIGADVLADAHGWYKIQALPSTQEIFEYRISVTAAGYGCESFHRISIKGEPGSSVEMETIVLRPADQSVSGVVVDAQGKPAARVPIFLHGDGQPDRSGVTDEDGRFVIKRICKGQFRLQASFDSSPGGAGFIKAEGGDKDVRIILGQKLVHSRYVSLLDKPLPKFDNIKIDFTPEKEKAILLCFWDMQQRPSRHCIKELARQADQLKEKGLVVIAVQASKIDKNTLNDWVKKYNIPFTVGMIEGDEEKTRFTWGVKSLPWLILTNAEHIVQAEGFGLNEIDEKMKKMATK